MKRELREWRKVKELNDTSEQILCVREHCQSLICVTVTMGYDCFHAVSEMLFKEYLLGQNGDISQTCIGKSPCEVKNGYFKIIDMGIDEHYQNNGYGSLLLSEILKFAKSFSVNKIKGDIYRKDIESTEKRERLYHFYEKHGFFIDFDKLMILKIR